jgi:DNA replication licensing factor MCM7
VNFKTSPEQTLTHAIGQINIDDDDLSDEYDFMDDDDEAQEQRRREKAASKQPKHKYADMMQKLADRSIDEVLIELDDLVTASLPCATNIDCLC